LFRFLLLHLLLLLWLLLLLLLLRLFLSPVVVAPSQEVRCIWCQVVAGRREGIKSKVVGECVAKTKFDVGRFGLREEVGHFCGGSFHFCRSKVVGKREGLEDTVIDDV
jgi:hypothetical protein